MISSFILTFALPHRVCQWCFIAPVLKMTVISSEAMVSVWVEIIKLPFHCHFVIAKLKDEQHASAHRYQSKGGTSAFFPKIEEITSQEAAGRHCGELLTFKLSSVSSSLFLSLLMSLTFYSFLKKWWGLYYVYKIISNTHKGSQTPKNEHLHHSCPPPSLQESGVYLGHLILHTKEPNTSEMKKLRFMPHVFHLPHEHHWKLLWMRLFPLPASGCPHVARWRNDVSVQYLTDLRADSLLTAWNRPLLTFSGWSQTFGPHFVCIYIYIYIVCIYNAVTSATH